MTVPITSFTATDSDDKKRSLARVTGCMVQESSTAPNSSDDGWQNSPPSEYAFASEGQKTLYAWAEDAVGDVSAAVSIMVNITLAAANIPPVADAGPDQTVSEGTSVILDGSASSGVDDAIATFLWEQIDTTGVTAQLSDPTAPNPVFTINDMDAAMVQPLLSN